MKNKIGYQIYLRMRNMDNQNTRVKHKKLYDTSIVAEHVSSILKESGMNFANYVLKNNARLNKPMDFDTAYSLGVFTLYPYYLPLRDSKDLSAVFGKPEIAKVQAIAVLSSIYNKCMNESDGAAEQLAGITAAVIDHDIGNAPYGFIPLAKIPSVADNCGTGGDTIPTFHVSSASGILAATMGLVVAKHGSPGNTRKSGSSDFIGSFNIDTFAPPSRIIKSLQKTNFGYIEALDTRYKVIHVQTHHFSEIAHMNDIIGPMTNPVDPSKLTIKLIGTNQVLPPKVIANAYVILNKLGVTNVRNGMAVKGYGKSESEKNLTMDEISTLKGGTEAVAFGPKGTEELMLGYEDFGLARPSEVNEISPPEGSSARIQFTNKVLEGKSNEGATNLLLANTAMLIALRKGSVDSLYDSMEIARSALNNCDYRGLLRRVATIAPKPV